MYYGNPEAESPNYDFALNLPALLDPAPARRAIWSEEEPNPAYRPKPLPLTGGWPWLIYAVLGPRASSNWRRDRERGR